MLKITINQAAYLCPIKPQEATLEFYERIYLRLPNAKTLEEQCASLIGCRADEVASASGALKHQQLIGYLQTTMQWLEDWAKEMKEAKPKPIRLGNVEYALPKHWMRHQFRAHIQLNEWLKGNSATLVSDVISLYLCPTVCGDDWSDEDREALRLELLRCRASEVAPLFFYALSNLVTFKEHGIRVFLFRLLRWTLARRMRWGF